MTCACIGNEDDTAIIKPCQLHAAWAKGYAVAQLERRVREADAKAGGKGR